MLGCSQIFSEQTDFPEPEHFENHTANAGIDQFLANLFFVSHECLSWNGRG
jgi:hypothetical protein